MRKAAFILSSLMMTFLMSVSGAHACSTCGSTICQLGKGSNQTTDQKWYVRFLYDQVLWKEKAAQEANDLVSSDHDVHDRTKDATYHYQLGRHITDDFNLMIDLPYMTKDAIEIADVDHLGEKQRSKGLGDVQILGDYRLWHNDNNGVSLAGGIKIPTGDTHRKDSMGNRFETDMQPGSGAYNYIVGGIYKFNMGQFSIVTNASRVFTVKGAQGFEYGDLFTASLLADYLINPHSKNFNTYVGMDTVFQNEWKEKTNGIKNLDSGGDTTLMGPVVRVDATKNLSITGSMLFPISQNVNGYTQKQNYEWTLGTEVRF